MKKKYVRIHLLIRMKYKNRTNKKKHSRTNKQTERKELIMMEDNDDHNEDGVEAVVHSSVVDDHSHKVQVEVRVHYILAVEKDVVVEEDHMIVVVDEYRVDNLFEDHNKVVDGDYHMEDIVVDVVALDNVKQVDEEDVANLVDFDTYVEEVND
jgi:hypothetical protein